MRKLVITQNISLDGSIEFLGDWFDPTASDPEQRAVTTAQSAASDALLLGRRTFEDFRSFWPHQTDDQTGVSDYLNQVRKYVVSATLTDPEWDPTTVLTDPVAEVRALKEADGADITCTGSITLTHALIGAGLVDEYRLFVYPAVQGAGRRLFPDGHEATLRALESRPFANGVTLMRFAPLG